MAARAVKVDNDNSEPFIYEEAVAELEKIVQKLSVGDVSLDESIALYERGVYLATKCDKKINEIEKKISVINKKTGAEEDLNL